jgi:hypothetical protein
VIEEQYVGAAASLLTRIRPDRAPERITPLGHAAAHEDALVRWLTGRTSRALMVATYVMVAAVGLAAVGQLFTGVEWQNEGELLDYPWLMLKGYVPYRDIWMMYPPGVFALLAGLLKVGIPPLIAERGLSIVARLAYVALVNRALTNSWRRVSWIGVLTTFSLLFLAIPARSSPYIVGAPVLFLALLTARDRVPLSAALFIAAGLFRFELGIVGLASLTALALFRWGNGEDGRSALLGAFSVLGISSLVYGALNVVAAGKALPEIFLLPIMVINPGRRVPLFPPQFGPLGVPIEIALLTVPIVVVLLTLKLRRPYLAATNIGTLCLMPHLVQHANWEHLCITAAMVLPWNLLTLTSLLSRSEDQIGSLPVLGKSAPSAGPVVYRMVRWTTRFCWITACIYPAFLVLAWFLYFSSLSPISSFHGWNDTVTVGGRTIIAFNPAEARADGQVARYLVRHAGPNDRLFISQGTLVAAESNPVVMYYLSGMQPANSHLELNPGVENTAPVERQIIGTLHPGTWIVEWTAGLGTERGVNRGHGSHVFERWVRAHTRLMLEDSNYRVLRVS